MSDQQAPPDRLVIDVTIQGGKVTPTNAQLQARSASPSSSGSTATSPTSCTCTRTPSTPSRSRPSRASRSSSPSTCPGKVDVELHQLNKTDRHHHSAVNADRSVAVLAHGLGGSTDLPIPFTYALIGAAWALTFTFAVVALAWRQPRFDPDKPGRALPPWVTAVVDAPVTRWAVGDRGAAVRGLGGARRVPRSAGRARTRCPACSTCCCGSAWWRCRWLFGPVWRVLSPVRTRAPPARPAGRSAAAYPEALGLLARGARPVRVRVAGAGQPRSGIAWRDADLAADLPGASPWPVRCGAVTRWCARADPFEVYSVVASRLSPLRRNRRRPHRDRQPVRPPAVAAGAAGHRRGAGRAAGIDGVRQLLGDAAVAQLRRRARGHRRVTATLIRTAGLLVFAGGGRGARSGWRRGPPAASTAAAPRAARADGALADPDRHRLRVRPLPDLSGRARPADRHPLLLRSLDARA